MRLLPFGSLLLLLGFVFVAAGLVEAAGPTICFPHEVQNPTGNSDPVMPEWCAVSPVCCPDFSQCLKQL